MYRALRPSGPSKTARVFRTFFVCSCLAWLGWCLVEIAHYLAFAFASAACSAAGQSWGGVTGSCDSPPIELRLETPAPAAPKSPLNGPGGA